MVGYLTTVDMEKQQISPAQVVIRHNRCPTVVVHLIGRARELSLKDLVVGIKNQPATVEAFIRPRAPPDITENLHTILPTSYPIHGFFFYPFLDNNGNIIRLFIIDDLKQSQGTTGLKEKDVDVVNNIIRIKDSREGLLDSRKMECIDGEVVVTVNEKLKDFRDREFNLLNAQISMVLYICSQINDIKEKNQFKRSEKHKKHVHTHHELPAQNIREWDVGIRMGQAIRQYRQAEPTGKERTTIGSKRPHIRRGHWHTYWTGSKKPELAHERKPRLIWLPPVPVNLEDVNKLPVVITPIDK